MAEGITYVALGDSVAAGLGAGPILDECGHTANAYPVLVAAANSLTLTQLSCSGATMADVGTTQLPQVPADTNFVSVQVGANDIGFVPLLQTCAPARSNAACSSAVKQSRAYLNGAFRDTAIALFTAIKGQAANSRLIVVGYPRLFGSRDCSPLTSFSTAERIWLNDLTNLLDTRLRQGAEAVGAAFVNPLSRFKAHPWCAKTPWVNGPVDPVVASFHPNELGQVNGYLPLMNMQFLS